MKLKVLVVMFSALMSSYVFSSGVFLGEDTKVKRIRMSNEGQAVIYTSNQTGKASCATVADGFVLELGAGDLPNRFYSTMLTALAADKSINMWCPNDCIEAYDVLFTRCVEVSIE